MRNSASGAGSLPTSPPATCPGSFPTATSSSAACSTRSVRREPSGGGWRTDYPYGEINLTTRFSELTRTPVSRGPDGRPNHYVVRITDDELFECPFTMASDVGTIGLQDDEAARLRLYLLKGGFLWVDDFWGDAAWEQWTQELARVLPPSEYPIEDVPMTDPIFRSQFTVTKVPQITNIGFWRRTGGRETSERGDESRDAHFRVIRDHRGRIMVVMTHNTDVGRLLGARGGGPGILPPVLAGWLCPWHQRAAACDDALNGSREVEKSKVESREVEKWTKWSKSTSRHARRQPGPVTRVEAGPGASSSSIWRGRWPSCSCSTATRSARCSIRGIAPASGSRSGRFSAA